MGGVGACSFFCCSLLAPPPPPPPPSPSPRPRPLSSPSMSISMFKRCKPHRPQRKLTTCQINLNPPPYPMNALEPHMSRETVEYHWGRHHRAHVDALNRHIAGTELDAMPLPNIILAAYNKGDPLPSFHHASEVWNHDFFWQSMKPGGGGYPSGVLVELINRDFGSLDRMLKEFSKAAFTQFGSGWAWLVYKANRLDVENALNPRPSEKDNQLLVAKTPNAVNPLVWDYSPILAIDLWEHSYYLDFENRRANYVSTFLEKLVSWEVVTHRLEMAIARAAERAREEERRREAEEGIEIGGSEAVEMYLDSDNEVEAE